MTWSMRSKLVAFGFCKTQDHLAPRQSGFDANAAPAMEAKIAR